MRKRFQSRYLVAPVGACTIIIGIVVMNMGNRKAGIEGNKVDFGYPFFSVKLLMGKPDQETSLTESDQTVYHYYDRTFFGHKGDISYDTQILRVNRIVLKINISTDEASTLFYVTSKSIENEYKDKTGYYCDPIFEKETGELIQHMGVRKGAGGISFTLNYLNGEFKVDGSYQ